MKLVQQRCLNHPTREAAARCPQCAQYYCRECVTEHEARVLCASCLKRLSVPAARPRYSFAWLGRGLQAALGLFMVWLFFLWLGSIVLSIDTPYHEGAVWEALTDKRP
jgi:hypothetical protein